MCWNDSCSDPHLFAFCSDVSVLSRADACEKVKLEAMAGYMRLRIGPDYVISQQAFDLVRQVEGLSEDEALETGLWFLYREG